MASNSLQDIKIFGLFAGVDSNRWEYLRGCPVKHKSFSWGKIKDISQDAADKGIHLIIEFRLASKGGKIKTLKASSFADGLFVAIDYDLSSIPGFIQFKEEIIEDIRKKEILAVLRAKKKEEKEKRKAKEKEQLKKLNVLNNKYEIRRKPFSKFNLPLYEKILKVEAEEELTEEEIEWLAAHKFYPLLAFYFTWLFDQTDDLWNVVKAASYLRKADYPIRAFELLKDKSTEDKKLMAAIHTCKAAALKDMGSIKKAMEVIEKAIKLDPYSYHAYSTLGGICYLSGFPEDGFKAFQRAIALGANPEIIKREKRRYLMKRNWTRR